MTKGHSIVDVANGDIASMHTELARLEADLPRHLSSPAYLCQIGALKIRLGYSSDAQRLLSASLALDPNNADAHFYLALSKISLLDINGAIQSLRTATHLRKNFFAAQRQLAALLEQRGDTSQALKIYHDISRGNPGDIEAINNRCVLLRSTGKLEEAIKSYESAISKFPNNFRFRLNYAICLRDAGRKTEALDAIEIAATLPDHTEELLWVQSLVYFELSRYLDATKSLRKLFSVINPSKEHFRLLGFCLRNLNRSVESLEAFKHALALDPVDADTNFAVGYGLLELRKPSEAIPFFRRATEIRANYVDAYNNLGTALKLTGDVAGAAAAYRHAIEIDGASTQAHYNLGVLHHESSRFLEALDSYENALRIDPTLIAGYYNSGAVYHSLKNFSAAKRRYQQALELDPKHGGALWNIGLLYLTQGNYEAGLELYENRFNNEDFRGVYSQNPPFELWTGQPTAAGTKILVLHEQGLGDTIQFSRFLRALGDLGLIVTVLAPKPLHRILATIPGVNRVTAEVDLSEMQDFYCHIMSLAKIFRTRIDSIIYSNQPYLFSDHSLVEKWQKVVRSPFDQRKVGLMWSGGSASKIKGRSMTLADFDQALLQGIDFISLQKDLSDADLGMLRQLNRVRHFGEQQTDFADAAALISLVDIVVSVDTSIAHLAGALGKETWIMLPFNADWRWLEDRDDSPWYSTVRLFRQKTQDDWSTVIAEIAGALRQRFMTG